MSEKTGAYMEYGSLFASMFGAGLSAKGQQASGQSMQALMDYNARVNDLKAEDAVVRGAEAERRLRVGAKGLVGASRAAFAAGGVEVNDPDSTAGNVQVDIAQLSELDALTIRSNAAREAWGYRTEAKDLRYRGAVAKQEGDVKAIGTLVSGVGSVLATKYGFGRTASTPR